MFIKMTFSLVLSSCRNEDGDRHSKIKNMYTGRCSLLCFMQVQACLTSQIEFSTAQWRSQDCKFGEDSER